MRILIKRCCSIATKFNIICSIAIVNMIGHSIYANEITSQSEIITNITDKNLPADEQKSITILVAQAETEKPQEQSAEVSAEKIQPLKLDKVEVTGSHIRRTDIEGVSPVLRLDREQIDKTGATTISELLRQLPINYGESFDEKLVNSFSPGSSGLSLRGLGQENTLVLLDGRRLANYGFAQNLTNTFVNLNSIPLSAIERVEILKDGASAIYGSDAVAGVVNIITRKDYEGTEISATYGETSHGDGNEGSINLITGWNTAKSNLTLIFDYFKRSEILFADRDFSKSSDHTAQGGDDFRSLSTPLANVFDAVTEAPLAPIGLYDFNPYLSLVPETERTGAALNYTLEINPELTFFTQLGYANSSTEIQQAPTAEFADFVIPAGQAYNTYGVDVVTLWRMSEWGNRQDSVETDNGRIAAGFEGIIQNWDWKAAVNYNRSKTVMDGKNYVNLAALETAVINDQVNPFGTSPNSQAVIDGTKATIQRTGVSELYGADIIAVGEIAQLKNGPVNLAVGIGTRHESLEDTPDSLTEQGLIVGGGGTSTKGDRDVNSAYAEFKLPLVDNTELQLAMRYEDYSDFGSETTPKVGIRYQPNSEWLLRGSWGKGFRAPSLPELYLGQTTAFSNDVVYGGVQRDAVIFYQGNPDLDAVKSESYVLGGLWEPIKEFTLGIDYWNYDINNGIEQDPQYVVDNYPGNVVDVGPVILIDSTFYNVATIKTDGIDLNVTYKWRPSEYGQFSLGALATYLLSYDRQRFSGQAFENLRGTYRYPKWRAVMPLSWNRNVFGATLTANYIDGYDDTVNLSNPDNKVDSTLTWDIQFVYTGIRKSTLTLGVKNLTDEDPPFANEVSGYDYAMNDPRGRFMYGTFAYKF